MAPRCDNVSAEMGTKAHQQVLLNSVSITSHLELPTPQDISYFFESTAARNRSSDSTSAGSATVSAISWRKSSRYRLRSL